MQPRRWPGPPRSSCSCGRPSTALLSRACWPGTPIPASRRSRVVPADPNLGASAVGEVVASPTALAFGPWTGPRWKATQTVVVRNVSTRPLAISLSAVSSSDSRALRFTVAPYQLKLRVGETRNVSVTVTSPTGRQRLAHHRVDPDRTVRQRAAARAVGGLVPGAGDEPGREGVA